MIFFYLIYNCVNVVEWEYLIDYYYLVILLLGLNGCILCVMFEIKIYLGRVDDIRLVIF